jgi:hypothetical protein
MPLCVVTIVGISAELIDCGFAIDSSSFFGHPPRLDFLPSMQSFHLKRLKPTPNSLIIVEEEIAIFAVLALSLKFFCSLVVKRLLVYLWNFNIVSIVSR